MPHHILLVDDNETIRKTSQLALQLFGHQVSIAANATEAIDILETQQQNLDLVITDFQMPGMNGLQLAHQIRSISSQIPIILSTSSTPQELDLNKSYGINAFLKKPYKIEEMNQLIQEILNRNMKLIYHNNSACIEYSNEDE